MGHVDGSRLPRTLHDHGVGAGGCRGAGGDACSSRDAERAADRRRGVLRVGGDRSPADAESVRQLRPNDDHHTRRQYRLGRPDLGGWEAWPFADETILRVGGNPTPPTIFAETAAVVVNSAATPVLLAASDTIDAESILVSVLYVAASNSPPPQWRPGRMVARARVASRSQR